MNVLAGVAHKQLQSAYAGLKKSLQQEWAFVQRVTPGVGEAFDPVEEAFWEIFVLVLFRGLKEGFPARKNTRLTVKQAGLALPDPVQTAPENWTASYVITGHLVESLRGQVEFWTADHSACLWEGRLSVRQRGEKRSEEALTVALEGGPGTAGTSNATSGKDWGLAHGAALHSQQDEARGPGMAQGPLH